MTGFADIPVLAKCAGQIASGSTKRQHRGAGQEVVQRLLLDGVDAVAAGAAVRRGDDRVGLAGPHEAQPALTLVQSACPRADVALDPAVIE